MAGAFPPSLPPAGRGLSSARLWLAAAVPTWLRLRLQLPPRLPAHLGAPCLLHPIARSRGPPTLLPGHRAVTDPLVPCANSRGHALSPTWVAGPASPLGMHPL